MEHEVNMTKSCDGTKKKKKKKGVVKVMKMLKGLDKKFLSCIYFFKGFKSSFL